MIHNSTWDIEQRHESELRLNSGGRGLDTGKVINRADCMTGKSIGSSTSFCLQIKHLDGHTVKLEASGVTKPNAVQTIVGEGMPVFENGHRSGNLYVQYHVLFPGSLSEHQKKLVKQMSMVHDEL